MSATSDGSPVCCSKRRAANPDNPLLLRPLPVLFYRSPTLFHFSLSLSLMANQSDLKDWEFVPVFSDSSAFAGLREAIHPDYFSLDPSNPHDAPMDQKNEISPTLRDPQIPNIPYQFDFHVIEPSDPSVAEKVEVFGAGASGEAEGDGEIGEEDGIEAPNEANAIEPDLRSDIKKTEVFSAGDSVKEAGDYENGEGDGIEAEKVVEMKADEEKKGMGWWKTPLELLKCSAFRVGPVWSVSMAAAAMVGFVILGRSLYRKRQRSRSIPIKMSINDKKATQVVLIRAARLNESLSVVKRVPVIRSSAQAGGNTPWPIVPVR